MEEIKLLYEIGDEKVTKREVKTESGQIIEVYELKNMPFCFLQHGVDYKKYTTPNQIGYKTSKMLLEDPSLWDKAYRDRVFVPLNGKDDSQSVSTSICASYIDLHKNPTGLFNNILGLIYGFDHVDPNSILFTSKSDGATNITTDKDPKIDRIDENFLSDNNAGGEANYNEIRLKRYKDNGSARRPDYIIVRNGVISEESLRHAAYFKIPIISIDINSYVEENEKRSLTLFNSISDNDSLDDIMSKIESMACMDSKLGRNLNRLVSSTISGTQKIYSSDTGQGIVEGLGVNWKRAFEIANLAIEKNRFTRKYPKRN